MISIVRVLLLVAALGACGEAEVRAPEGYQGVVELEEWALGFELPGRLVAVAVKPGDVVQAGQELARLDRSLEQLNQQARTSELAVARAQAALLSAGARTEEVRALQARLRAVRSRQELVQRNVARQENLTRSGAAGAATLDQTQGQLSEVTAERQALEQQLQALRRGARSQEHEAAAARVAMAETAVQAAQERLARHILVAPAAAVVLDVHVETGEVVGAGMPIVTLGDPEAPYVDVFVPQAQVSAVALGAPVTVRVDGVARAAVGRVEHVGRRTEFTPRYLFSERERPNLVVRVRVRVEEGGEGLRAGIPATIRVGAP